MVIVPMIQPINYADLKFALIIRLPQVHPVPLQQLIWNVCQMELIALMFLHVKTTLIKKLAMVEEQMVFVYSLLHKTIPSWVLAKRWLPVKRQAQTLWHAAKLLVLFLIRPAQVRRVKHKHQEVNVILWHLLINPQLLFVCLILRKDVSLVMQQVWLQAIALN